jgi:succinate dehydrogenase / fumarate reductase, cytochrome b subunit
MAEAKLRGRPLSPHLQIYRWTWTMTMSIMHRITGGALYVGTILLAFWLLSMASGPAAYDRAAWFFNSLIGRLILFVYTFILMQHMIGGIRHLIWDFGYGMEPGTRMNMARATPIAAAILTLLIWITALVAR